MSVSLRTRRFIARYGRLAAIALVLVGVGLSAWAGLAYTSPTTERVTQQTNVQEVSTSLETSANVTGNTTLYTPGERLVNQPVYLMEATPNLTYTVRTNVPDGSESTVEQRLILYLSASRNGQVFWKFTRVFVADRQAVSDGTAVARSTVNMSAINQFISGPREKLGGIGQFTTEVRLTVTYNTGTYEGELTTSAPLVFTSRAYYIDGDLSETRTHSETISRRVTRPPEPSSYLLPGALGLVAFLGAGVIVYLRRQDVDLYNLEREYSESQYEEWISKGQIPTDPERKYITIASLEDLVDIAIDSGKRVIHDTEYNVYAVTDGDIVYYFSRDDFDFDAWLNM